MLNKNKKIGLSLIIAPFVGLVLVFIVYAIVSFTMAMAGSTTEVAAGSAPSLDTMIGSIISIILGLIGVLCVLGIIIGVPLGIIFLAKKGEEPAVYDERSGKGDKSTVPEEIKGWNWGALGLHWIWGVYYNVWISLLVLIPFFGLVWIFVLGAKGNEWAWRKNKWQSVEQFKNSQNKWKIWGIIFFVLMVLGFLNNIMTLINYISTQS